MMGLAPFGRIFLRRQPTDMRKSFDGLSGIVRGELGHDPLAGDLFVFVNWRHSAFGRTAALASSFVVE